MKRFLLLSSVAGVVVFGAMFLITFLSPGIVDKAARAFVIAQIEREVSEHEIAGVKTQALNEKLSWFKDKYGNEIKAAKSQLAGDFRIKIEEILEKICKLDCLKQKGIVIADTTDESLKQQISKLTHASEKFSELIKGKYYRIISELLTDFRIFSGINLILFVIIGCLLYSRGEVAASLILPAGLLLLATILSITIYILGQNWFYTLIFSSYMGWGYLTYVGLIFGFLLDIVFNQAAITTTIIDSIAGVLKNISECFSAN